MKKIFSVLTILTLILSSCNNAIDIEQPGTLLAENAFQSVQDFELGVLGILGRLDNTVEILANAVFTDELAIGQDSGGQNVGNYSLNLNPTSGIPATLWISYYISLNQVNKVIDAIDAYEVGTDEGARINNAKGQLLAIRAYLHFQVTTYFSTNYADEAALGAVLLDFVPSFSTEYPRNTNGEVYASIEADLAAASSLLTNTSSRTFISKDFVTALKARMYAYRGQYTLALANANTLLAKYPLATSNQFTGMLEDSNEAGIIFELERTQSDDFNNQGTGGGGWAGSLFAFINSTISGSPFMEMSRSLFNELDANPGDIRRSAYVDSSSLIDPAYASKSPNNPDDILVIKKYPGHDSQPLMNDIKIFRASEMLLIKAEAEAIANNFAGAAASIKQLRDARFASAQPAPSYTSSQQAFAGILAERRLELAFEGHRWIDIKRLGGLASVSIDRDPIDCSLYAACTLANGDFRYTMPIPLGEIDVAPELVQNAGY